MIEKLAKDKSRKILLLYIWPIHSYKKPETKGFQLGKIYSNCSCFYSLGWKAVEFVVNLPHGEKANEIF